MVKPFLVAAAIGSAVAAALFVKAIVDDIRAGFDYLTEER